MNGVLGAPHFLQAGNVIMLVTQRLTILDDITIGHDTFCTLLRYWPNTISILGRPIDPVLVQYSQTCSYNC